MKQQKIANERVKKWAAEVGFDLCGIAAITPLTEAEHRYRRWLEEGHHASLDYLTRHIEKRFDASQLVEGARTVVVCAVAYKSPVSEGYPTDHRTKIASYACNCDYHTTIKEMLYHLLARMREVYPEIAGRAFVDSAPLAEKSWAVEAGLGWIGRQSLLITPQYGSFIHLGELVLTAEADQYDAPFEGTRCGSCRACINHCPTHAILDEEHMIDAGRCIACHTIEREPTIAIDLDGWIFGCDACQQCCPYNLHAPIATNEAFRPLFDPRALDAETWQTMSDEEFSARFGATPLVRAGLYRIKANIKR